MHEDERGSGLSGRELLHAIREDDSLRFFLTARVGTAARIASLDAGADDYLTKPFHHGELLARARNLIRARRQERELADLNRRLENRVDEQMGELLRTGQLKRFLPPAVAEQLVRGDLDAGQSLERKRVTILVARVPELEKIGEGLEPEDLTEPRIRVGVATGYATVESSAVICGVHTRPWGRREPSPAAWRRTRERVRCFAPPLATGCSGVSSGPHLGANTRSREWRDQSTCSSSWPSWTTTRGPVGVSTLRRRCSCPSSDRPSITRQALEASRPKSDRPQ